MELNPERAKTSQGQDHITAVCPRWRASLHCGETRGFPQAANRTQRQFIIQKFSKSTRRQLTISFHDGFAQWGMLFMARRDQILLPFSILNNFGRNYFSSSSTPTILFPRGHGRSSIRDFSISMTSSLCLWPIVCASLQGFSWATGSAFVVLSSTDAQDESVPLRFTWTQTTLFKSGRSFHCKSFCIAGRTYIEYIQVLTGSLHVWYKGKKEGK